MTVGLPGSGVGGIFYLLSALWMPFDALLETGMRALGLRSAEDRRAPQWRLVWRQFAIALGIIAGLWVTGWLLALLLISHPSALGQAQTTRIAKRLPNVLRMGAFIASLGTLFAVLATVQIARLVVAVETRRVRRQASPVVKIAASLLFLVLVPAVMAQTGGSASTEVALHIAAADRAYASGDATAARHEYEAALAIDPAASRALYRLGELSRANPATAEPYFRRYTRAERTDAWGWIALGDILSQEKRFHDALAAYDRAVAIAPNERDVVVGRARVLSAAGHTDDAIAAYERWTASHPRDAEAQRELAAQQRRAGRYGEAARTFRTSDSIEPNRRAVSGESYARGFTAPSVRIVSGGSRDSEANQSVRAGAAIGFQAGDRARVEIEGSRRWLSGFSDVTVDAGSIGLTSRPLAAFRFEANAGVARPHSTVTVTDTIISTSPGSGNTRGRGRGNAGTPPVGTIIQRQSESSANIFVGGVRGVLRQPGGRSSLDLRATRTLVDATPVLVINRVVRNEVAGRADVEVIPRVKLRAGARAGTYSATGDDNTRMSLLGGVAVAATDQIELSGVFQTLKFSHATTSGYFAPQLAQLAEAATYAEFESDGGTVLAIDAGGGAQRLQEFGATIGKWEPAYRLFSSLDVPIRPGSAFHVELDSYDSRLGSDAPSSSATWRFVSLSASVRLALR